MRACWASWIWGHVTVCVKCVFKRAFLLTLDTRAHTHTRTQDDAYTLVADYLTPGADLNAGQLNGEYSFVDGSLEPLTPGVWVYRVQEEDLDGKRTTLSQTIIEVPSNSDKVKTLVAGGLIVAFLGAATFLGQSVDPMNGIN